MNNMKIYTWIFIVGLLIVTIAACTQDGAESNGGKVALKTEMDSLSYAWGVNIATFLKDRSYDELNYAILSMAMRETFEGSELPIDYEMSQKLITEFGPKLAAKTAQKYREEGEKFLAENAKKEGVTTLPSGLQYKVLVAGNGPVALDADRVKAHYHGTIISGEVFDSSIERGQPFEFAVGIGQVIPGWDEAFKLMPQGSKWILYIPADLAYGDNPRPGGPIKPGMTLIFEVELLEVQQIPR
jgi:FKBP-type peptidyl-prolyl cis-trans isomerase FklB